MIKQWISYLQNFNAQIADEQVLHFGQPNEEQRYALTTNTMTDFSHYHLLTVSGKDAQTFLQGQLTNDIRQVKPEQAQLTGWCNPKGRLLATFYLFQRQDHYHILVPASSKDLLLKRLRMYVLRAKVQIEDDSEQLLRIGVNGEAMETLLTNLLDFTPPTVLHRSETQNNLTLIRIHGIQPRYLIIGDNQSMQPLWEKLAAQDVKPIGQDAWQLLDILSGLVMITSTLAEEFVPQMINFQVLEGISFTKGCYTGQEVVARTQYLGNLKRRLYLIHISCDDVVPQTGDELAITTETQPIGKIISVQPHPEGGYIALAVLQIAHENNPIYLQKSPQATIQIQALPYALEKAS